MTRQTQLFLVGGAVLVTIVVAIELRGHEPQEAVYPVDQDIAPEGVAGPLGGVAFEPTHVATATPAPETPIQFSTSPPERAPDGKPAFSTQPVSTIGRPIASLYPAAEPTQ